MIKTSLFADQEREAKLNKLGDALQVMEQYVDFSALAAEVDRAAPRPGRERGGRPPFPTELMVRVLLIQQVHNLSDEQMEFQLGVFVAPFDVSRDFFFSFADGFEVRQNQFGCDNLDVANRIDSATHM